MPKANHIAKTFLLLMAAMLLLQSLQGCGWRLRGSTDIELAVPPVALAFQGASAPLQRDLRQALASSGVQVVDGAKAVIKLVVFRDTQGRRVLSVGSAGKVSEYELQYQLAFSISDQNDKLLAKDVITQQRDYRFDEAQVLAKGDEERQLYDFMRRTAVQSLLRRLQASVSSAHTDVHAD